MDNTILIVDGIETNRRMLEKILIRKYDHVLIASSAEDALKICQNRQVDLCLLDVNMPGMNGFELADAFKLDDATKNIHIIFVSGLRNNRSNELKGLGLGAMDYIEKPIDREVLLSKISTRLNAINQEKELRLTNQKLKQQLTNSRNLEQELLLSAAVFNQGSNAILITDENQKIIRVNKAFSDITGFSEAEVIGQTPKILSSGKHDKYFYQEMWRSIQSTGSWTGEIWNKRKDGNVYPELQSISVLVDSDERPNYYVAIFSDLSQHKRQQAQIEQLAHYDSLTQLANKHLFNSLLTKNISNNDSVVNHAALLFLDVNDFKKYNNSLGHEFGDKLLLELSGILEKCANKRKALLSHFGGDKFVIWLKTPNNDARNSAEELIGSIQAILDSPLRIDGYEAIINCSIGISVYPDDGNKGSILIRKAETAMYQAKLSGSLNHSFFQDEMAESARHRLQLENELRVAIPNGHLKLYYQPQVDMKSKKIIGAEALLRWHHDELGFVSPADFIPVAEKSSLIVALGNDVITQACQQIREWEQNGLFEHLTSVSVNVSPLQFEYPLFMDNLKQAIELSDINPAHLVIELTETALVNDHRSVGDRLNQIKEIGCSISIDDFGTGYSSLRYLSTFPVDVLKIDKCFVDNVSTSKADLAVINAIVSMGKMLDAKIIVEGVESEHQLTTLNSNNECSAYQGYLFSPAVTADKFKSLVSNSNSSQRRQAV